MRRRVRSERGFALVILAIVVGAVLLSSHDQLGTHAAVTTPAGTTPTTPTTAASTTATTAAGTTATTVKTGTTTTTKKGSTAVTTTTTAPALPAFSAASRAQVQLGSKGSDVTALQQRLTALGYTPGAADGAFGPATATAVKAFQAAKSLTADGIVGSATWTALAAGK